MKKSNKVNAIIRVVEHLGSQRCLAQHLNITQQAVSSWISVAKRVPAEYVLKMEKLTNGKVTRYELRPDLYPIE